MAIIPALGHLKDERAVPLLIKALNNLDEDWLGREAAARALGDIGATKAMPGLIRAAGCRKLATLRSRHWRQLVTPGRSMFFAMRNRP